MNKAHTHPHEDELLLFLDGELDSHGLDSVKVHLHSCWTCRMRAASVQAAILEYAKERERSVVPHTPRPWRDLTEDFRRVRDAAGPSSLFTRIRTGAIFRNLRVGLFCGAATAIAAIGWVVMPHESKRMPEKTVTGVEASPDIRLSAPAAYMLPPATTEVHRKSMPVLDASALLHEEVAVVAELHRLEADLGEPISLEHTSDGRLLLRAFGLGLEREQDIRNALARFPDLVIDFAHPSVGSGTASSNRGPLYVPRGIAFQEELARYAGGRPALQQLADSVLEASDHVSMYAHAAANLEKRFPAASQALMNGEDRMLLNQIRRDYLSEARTSAESLQKQLEPIFRTLNIESKDQPAGTLLEVALRLDRLVNAAFSGAQSDLSDRELYGQIRSNLSNVLELLP